MALTIPGLPDLAGTSVVPNVPAHALTDADVLVLNNSATVGIGADRKATIAQVRPKMHRLKTAAIGQTDVNQSVLTTLATLDVTGLEEGLWDLSCFLSVVPLSSTPLSLPYDFNLQLFAGGTLINAGLFPWDQKQTRYDNSLVLVSGNTAQLHGVIYDNSIFHETSFTLKCQGTVGTGGADTYRVSAGGRFTARRVWAA